MKQNVGGIDKMIRMVLGLGMMWYGYTSTMWWLVVVGVVAFLTGMFGRCGLYALIGFSTCKLTTETTKTKNTCTVRVQ